MRINQKQAFLFLVIIFVIFALFTLFTNSLEAMLEANLFFLIVACVFFIVSICLWVFSWAFLLKKNSRLSFKKVFLVGYSSVYASLTPLQLGTDALRALLAKEFFNSSFSSSIAASMVTKGLKFFLIAILASLCILFFLVLQTNVFFKTALLSGFAVIALAAALFLLPMNKKIGRKIACFFKFLGKVSKKFFLLEKYFLAYSDYLDSTGKKAILFVFALVAFSTVFEFFSLYFSFHAAGAFLELNIMVLLFVLASILEHVPFSPRGVGLVESISFVFLSLNAPAISGEKIAAALVLFGVARLIVPAITSFILYSVISKKLRPHSRLSAQ